MWASARTWITVIFGLWCAVPIAEAATVLAKTVTVDVVAGGRVLERTALKVRLEGPGDLEAWAYYPVYLDTNRRLASFDAWVTGSDGRRQKVGRKRQDRVEYAGDGVVDSSHYFHVVELPGLAAGTILDVAHEVEAEPYHSSGQMTLLTADPIAALDVTLRGTGLRWRLDGPAEGLTLEEIDGGVHLSGRDLPAAEAAELAAGGAASEPVLRYAWGEEGWEAVGGWYRGLMRDLPRDAPEVQRLAAELTSADEAPRQKLESLLAYLRRKVRYVAVEVGIGGYRPSAPEEVLDRKWGDCKDKSLLLIDLLREAGIDAHPALILLDTASRIEPDFPSPSQFNHLIVAVPETAVATEADDPTAAGYLFLDPTQTRGGARWLHPGVQDQDALVITAAGSALARTPLRPQHESHRLAVDFVVSPEGHASGRAGLLLQGQVATGFIDQMESAPPERTTEDVLAIFSRLLPGAVLSGAGWEPQEGAVPAVRMSLAVNVDNLVQGAGRSPSFRLSSLRVTPEPHLLDDLDVAAVYPARRATTTWRLTLPASWCPPKAGERMVETAVGSYRQTVTRGDDGVVTIERRSELNRRWFEPEMAGDFRELALAEHRASKRRIRLLCDASPPASTPGR